MKVHIKLAATLRPARTRGIGMAWIGGWIALAVLLAAPSASAGDLSTWAEETGAALAKTLATACPPADPSELTALERCRQALRDSPLLDDLVAPYVTWGGGDGSVPLKSLNVTEFNADIYRTLYLPLFTFTGEYRVELNSPDHIPIARLQATFRHRLMPGVYPYPFWHKAEKWIAYERAREIVVYLDPPRRKAVAFLRSVTGNDGARVDLPPAPIREFDGKWTWKDSNGTEQPVVTLFDGYFSRANPHLEAVEHTYRQFALSLRDAECLSCHVPNNPNRSRRLILMQTPLHAAGEIERALANVTRDKMPLEEWGDPKPLSAEQKRAFIAKGEAFARALDEARAWEATPR